MNSFILIIVASAMILSEHYSVSKLEKGRIKSKDLMGERGKGLFADSQFALRILEETTEEEDSVELESSSSSEEEEEEDSEEESEDSFEFVHSSNEMDKYLLPSQTYWIMQTIETAYFYISIERTYLDQSFTFSLTFDDQIDEELNPIMFIQTE